MTDELRELAVRVLIACVAVTWLVILWRSHRDPRLVNFSFPGLIMTREGYIDRVALMELGSWITMTLLLIMLAAHDRMTELYATIYVAFPAVRAGQVSMLRANLPVQQTGTTVTDTVETSKTTARTVNAPKAKR